MESNLTPQSAAKRMPVVCQFLEKPALCDSRSWFGLARERRVARFTPFELDRCRPVDQHGIRLGWFSVPERRPCAPTHTRLALR